MERKHTPIYGIKGKLVSAVAMLLVAIVMVVSSTYAWFTLSTAPEVSGIQTSIGANGALEIWLNTSDTEDTNYTHGNIVELADTKYGLQTITLLPSVLQYTDNTKTKLSTNFVSIPTYEANGKPGALVNDKTVSGIFQTNKFTANDETGVRAVGVASGLTDRQLAYRNAKYAAATAASQAITEASSSLSGNGPALANIVIKKANNDAATYSLDEIKALKVMINQLRVSLAHIETAYEQMIIAYAANKNIADDTAWSTIKAAFDGTLTISAIVDNESAISITLPTEISTAIAALDATIDKVTAAATSIDALVTANKSSYTWNEIADVVNNLIDRTQADLNGSSLAGAIDKQAIADSVLAGNGINLTLKEGSGVYADIADHCKNYSVPITIPTVEVSGMTFNNLKVNMKVETEKGASTAATYLYSAQAILTDDIAPAGDAASAVPMTEFYGFILDLGFKTNAASSNLLLQTEAIDRIYADNNNELTQGGGSYMTFKSTTTDFTTEKVKGLMEHIKIVFFVTSGENQGKVLANAKLDVANATTDTNGNVKAKMYLTDAEGNMITNQDNAVITALAQNADTFISAFVYLDGETLENEHVAATNAKSVTGTMNIQFSSDADLVPMEYGDLHTPNPVTTTTTTTTTANP